jgi:hypothetical protein
MLAYPPINHATTERHSSVARRSILDDRTQRTLNEFNRNSTTVVAIKQNNPYGVSVIPSDVTGEMELRLQRQAMRQQQQQQQQLGLPFAGFLSDREPSPLMTLQENMVPMPSQAAAPSLLSPSALEAEIVPIAPRGGGGSPGLPPVSQLTKFYSNGRPMVVYATSPVVVAPITNVTPAARRPNGSPAQQPTAVVPPTPPQPAVDHQCSSDEHNLRSVVLTVQKRHGATEDCFVPSCLDLFPGGAAATIQSRSQLLNRHVIIEGDRGKDIGLVVAIRSADSSDRSTHLGKVFSVATDAQIGQSRDLAREEDLARVYCQNQIRRLFPEDHDHFIVERAVFQLDKEKLTFFYRVPARTYFVPLLKALNQHYRCRIWMERIVDDAADQQNEPSS